MINEEQLVIDYYKNKTDELKSKLVETYIPLVRVVARRLSKNLHEYIEYEDLCSFGVFGLVDAITKYTPGLGTKFETYASLRIKGSILDEVRKFSQTPRSVVSRKRLIDEAYRSLVEESKSTEKESLARELGISEKELEKWEYQIEQSKMVYIDSPIDEDGKSSYENLMVSDVGVPEKEVIEKMSEGEVRSALSEELKKLTEKERQVVLLYYYEELSLREISLVLEVTESRISQLHKNALRKLRKGLGSFAYLLSF